MGWPQNKILGAFRAWFAGEAPVPERAGMSVGWGLGLVDDGANDRAVLSAVAPVIVPVLHGGGSSSETTSNNDSIITTFYLDVAAWKGGAAEVRLYVLCGLASGGPTTWHVELYDQTNATSVAVVNRTETVGVPVQLDIDLTDDLLGEPEALYSLRLYSDSGDQVNATQSYVKIT